MVTVEVCLLEVLEQQTMLHEGRYLEQEVMLTLPMDEQVHQEVR